LCLQLRQDEIERKRAHLARLEESYLSRFGGPALGGATSPGPSSHAGSVAEELVEYADSMGTAGYEDDYGGGHQENYGGRQDDGYDRNRYSGEAEGEEGSGVLLQSAGGPMSASGNGNLPGGMGTMGMSGMLRGGAVGGSGAPGHYPGNGMMSPRSPMRASKIGFADDLDGVRIGDSQSQATSSDPNMNGFSPAPHAGSGNFNTPQQPPSQSGGGSGEGGGGASGGLSPEGYSGLAAFEARLEGLERSFTPPLVPPSNLRTAAAASAAEGGWGHNNPEAQPDPEGGGVMSQQGGGQGAQGGGSGEEIDLLYDPILSCYYDPKTNKYYELRA
jgi:hypothetical protein